MTGRMTPSTFANTGTVKSQTSPKKSRLELNKAEQSNIFTNSDLSSLKDIALSKGRPVKMKIDSKHKYLKRIMKENRIVVDRLNLSLREQQLDSLL